MKKKGLIILLAFVVTIAFMPVCSFAASSTAGATSYQVIKSGKTVYCSADYGVYKVTLKKGKVKKVKRIAKRKQNLYYGSMQKKGKYLYMRVWTEGTVAYISRIKTSGGKIKNLAYVNELDNFVVKGKKIYYDYYDYDKYDNEVHKCKVMNLKGKKKRNTSVRPIEKQKPSNANGYYMVSAERGGYVYDYLRTPKGTFQIGKTRLYDN